MCGEADPEELPLVPIVTSSLAVSGIAQANAAAPALVSVIDNVAPDIIN